MKLNRSLGTPRPQQVPMIPMFVYWEMLWNRLQDGGWALEHRSSREPNGGSRHQVFARRGESFLECTAPTMTHAVQVLYRSIQESES